MGSLPIRDRWRNALFKLNPYFDCDGHLLLDALALSATLGTPFELDEIRAFERKNPGLRPQHTAAIDLVRKLCGANVDLTSTRLRFEPGPLRPGHYHADVKTAGPISSVLQAALLPAVRAPGPVELVITGGTDVLYRPNVDYVQEILLPYYSMFADVTISVPQRGLFPRGDGRVVVGVEGQKTPPLPDLPVRPDSSRFRLRAVGMVDDSILDAVAQRLGRPVSIDRVSPRLKVRSLTLRAEAASGQWPCIVGSWRVGDGSVGPKFGTKLAGELLEALEKPVYDPRVELLAWMAGGRLAGTVSEDSNELAATKYLARVLGGAPQS